MRGSVAKLTPWVLDSRFELKDECCLLRRSGVSA